MAPSPGCGLFGVTRSATSARQPRPNRRGEARGLHVYEANAETLLVETYTWRDDDWGLTALRTFPRGRAPLTVEAAGERPGP